ncbi:MAG: iron-containing alcohol dehydrogenase [Candidatus Gastranaerophilales bacterium]|nr:iron-containing alcohol dehydrogenase [Candidatus Gastranaerophilales bacterium]
MNNFDFCCPTRVVFGKDTISSLKELIRPDEKVLITYGGGSIKKNGVYDQVKKALEDYNIIEFGGIEPNPTYETCMRAVEIVKKENITFILAVGGGSVLDGTKFIAAASKFGGEPWDILEKQAPTTSAIPLGSVITLPATGSEMNCGAVISRKATDEKLAFHSPYTFPRFSIIDPQTTFSLPERQTINGIVDTFVHVMEQYATYDVNTPLQDEWAFGIIKTLMREAPKVLKNPTDYDARANIFWCATTGLNYWISTGAVQDWSTHMIGHELTAFYGLDHGKTLAIVMPKLWKNQKQNKLDKLAKMAKEVYGATQTDENELADITIEKTEAFFNSIGQKTKLSDYGIDSKEAAEKIRERFKERGTVLGERGVIDADVAHDIVADC